MPISKGTPNAMDTRGKSGRRHSSIIERLSRNRNRIKSAPSVDQVDKDEDSSSHSPLTRSFRLTVNRKKNRFKKNPDRRHSSILEAISHSNRRSRNLMPENKIAPVEAKVEHDFSYSSRSIDSEGNKDKQVRRRSASFTPELKSRNALRRRHSYVVIGYKRRFSKSEISRDDTVDSTRSFFPTMSRRAKARRNSADKRLVSSTTRKSKRRNSSVFARLKLRNKNPLTQKQISALHAGHTIRLENEACAKRKASLDNALYRMQNNTLRAIAIEEINWDNELANNYVVFDFKSALLAQS